jgi:hypothetical protein
MAITLVANRNNPAANHSPMNPVIMKTHKKKVAIVIN